MTSSVRLPGAMEYDDSGLRRILCDFGTSDGEGLKMWIGFGAIYVKREQQT